jgi:hypothetical protein
MITPELLHNVSYLLGNGTTLLSPRFVNDTRSLVTGVAPVITPDLLVKVGNLLGNANELLSPKFVNETETLIEDASEVSFLFFQLICLFSRR